MKSSPNGATPTEATDVTHAAVSMLMSSFFADAMGRETMPAMYPQPVERAASAYVTLFLRALGLTVPRPNAPATRARSSTP